MLAESSDTNVTPDVDDIITSVNKRSIPSTDSSKLNVASVPLPAGNVVPINENPITTPVVAPKVVPSRPESAPVNVAPKTENWNPPKSYSES